MANWKRGDLFVKGSKEKNATFLFNVMNSKLSIHGFDLPCVNGSYIDSTISMDFGENVKLQDGTYIFKTFISSCGEIEIVEFQNIAQTFGVDIYVDVADPWGGINHALLIESGTVCKNEVTKLERE